MDMGEALGRARKRVAELQRKRLAGEVRVARNGEVYNLPALIEERAGPPDESQPVTPVKHRRF